MQRESSSVLIDVALTTGVIVGGVIVPLLLMQRIILGYAFVLEALGWQ